MLFPANLLTSAEKTKSKLECGPMPNVMAARTNIGDARCSTCSIVWLTPSSRVSCSNAAKTSKAVEISWGAPNYRIDLSR